jgi:hypothetical protein
MKKFARSYSLINLNLVAQLSLTLLLVPIFFLDDFKNSFEKEWFVLTGITLAMMNGFDLYVIKKLQPEYEKNIIFEYPYFLIISILTITFYILLPNKKMEFQQLLFLVFSIGVILVFYALKNRFLLVSSQTTIFKFIGLTIILQSLNSIMFILILPNLSYLLFNFFFIYFVLSLYLYKGVKDKGKLKFPRLVIESQAINIIVINILILVMIQTPFIAVIFKLVDTSLTDLLIAFTIGRLIFFLIPYSNLILFQKSAKLKAIYPIIIFGFSLILSIVFFEIFYQNSPFNFLIFLIINLSSIAIYSVSNRNVELMLKDKLNLKVTLIWSINPISLLAFSYFFKPSLLIFMILYLVGLMILKYSLAFISR